MNFKSQTLTTVLFFLSILEVSAQDVRNSPKDQTYFIGSTAFLLGNFIPDDPNSPDFVQLNIGYKITTQDFISLELKTWRYAWSLGIPYGDSFQAPEEKFPGYIREIGFAIAYQHFWWKGLYTGIHVMNAWQSFINENDQKIDNGFQFFNTYRLGYQVELFNSRFFIEPSIAITHRPYHTKMPESFRIFDDKWPKYFVGEPGLHFGFNF